ncbi:hypothetical protein VAEU17_3190015 [Vibrio aestuarianus]|nr:hypothetical protein VAEU17_3190015 [Vibrio aestuarianus]
MMQDFLPTLYHDFVSIREEITTSFVMITVLFIVLAVTQIIGSLFNPSQTTS